MRRAAMLVAAAAMLLGSTNLRAQAPNFSGTWTPVVDPNAAGGGGGGGRGGAGPMTITQDAKTLTISRTTGQGEIKTVYNLDGSDSKNTQMGRGGASTEVISHAKWDGATLVVTTTRDMNGTSVTTSVVYSLGADGKLSVATTAPGRGDPTPVTTTRMYTKG